MSREVNSSRSWHTSPGTRRLGRSINPILISLFAGVGLSLLMGPHTVLFDGLYLVPEYFLFLPALLGFGLPGVVGVALVPVVTAVLISGSLPVAIVTGVALLLVGYFGGRLSRVQLPRSPRVRFRRVGLVLVGTTPLVVVLTAIGYEIVGVRPIYVGLQTTAVAFGTAALLSLPLVWWIDDRMRHGTHRPQPTRTDGLAVVVLGWSWVGIAAIGSMGFHVGSQVPAYLYERQGIGGVQVVFDTSIFGPGGVRVQIIVTGILLAFLWIALHPRRSST